MIDKQTDQVAWALLMYELEDAEEGLKSLFKDLTEESECGEAEFRVHMAHIYTHLNRAWNARNATAEQHKDENLWNEWARFPTDLNPPLIL